MATYQVIFTHMTEDDRAKYRLINLASPKIILENVSYIEVYNWCVTNLRDDDLYEEIADSGVVGWQSTGAKLRKSQRK